MKFEIPFDENIYIKQVKLQFDYVWSESFKRNKLNLNVGIFALLLGILIVYGNGNLGYVFIVLGCGCLIGYYVNYRSYVKNKKRYFSGSKKTLSELKDYHKLSIWEFNDEYFRYKYYKCDYKIDWSLFTEFDIIEDNLFIKTKDVNYNYILDKAEVGDSAFNEIIEFLKTKIKMKTSA